MTDLNGPFQIKPGDAVVIDQCRQDASGKVPFWFEGEAGKQVLMG